VRHGCVTLSVPLENKPADVFHTFHFDISDLDLEDLKPLLRRKPLSQRLYLVAFLKMHRLLHILSFLLLASPVLAAEYPLLVQIPRQIRRFLNVGSLFGSATQADTPYDRIGGHPVFSVTTPWGSPYLNMEKRSDMEQDNTDDNNSKDTPQSVTEESNEYRTVCLYFMDPDDALGVHGEMKQMDNMASADLRLTSFSLAKALRQASNLGNGLLTGQPVDPLTGALPADHGSLRYKIVPPKRQLYYAARCIGRERVGLFADNPTEDAAAAVMGASAMEGVNLDRRRSKRERKTAVKKTKMQQQNAHMEGYTGIPVFWNPQMQKKLPLLKRLMTGVQYEIPMFFNYEDMEEAWQTLRQRNKRLAVPPQPEGVQVFNLVDLLTSMDRDAYATKQTERLQDKVLKPLKNRFLSQSGPDLQHVTFVPSSRSVQYKEGISARGNGKCRLRPMR
jgi:hypothetical protein